MEDRRRFLDALIKADGLRLTVNGDRLNISCHQEGQDFVLEWEGDRPFSHQEVAEIVWQYFKLI